MAGGRGVRPGGGTVLELWLIRHGETDWNVDGRIQGFADQPLNDKGRRQAGLLAGRLRDTGFDAVYASDLERARVTAEMGLPGADVRLDPRLRELSYGIFEGKSWTTLDAREAAAARHWSEDRFGRRIPGGESYGDLMERVAAFHADLPTRGRVAAFSHGGTIRSALYGILGRPTPGAWRVEIDNTSITRLRFDGRGPTVVTINDHAHVCAADAA
jgi:2,3-bisphosphoglycerate-dependent phosphoglycerate mutase